jgi:type VI protein secretion system component VasK
MTFLLTLAGLGFALFAALGFQMIRLGQARLAVRGALLYSLILLAIAVYVLSQDFNWGGVYLMLYGLPFLASLLGFGLGCGVAALWKRWAGHRKGAL